MTKNSTRDNSVQTINNDSKILIDHLTIVNQHIKFFLKLDISRKTISKKNSRKLLITVCDLQENAKSLRLRLLQNTKSPDQKPFDAKILTLQDWQYIINSIDEGYESGEFCSSKSKKDNDNNLFAYWKLTPEGILIS